MLIGRFSEPVLMLSLPALPWMVRDRVLRTVGWPPWIGTTLPPLYTTRLFEALLTSIVLAASSPTTDNEPKKALKEAVTDGTRRSSNCSHDSRDLREREV